MLDSVPFEFFLIIYGLALVVAIGCASLLRLFKQFKRVSDYLLGSAIGSVIGFSVIQWPWIIEAVNHIMYDSGSWPPSGWPFPILSPFSGTILGVFLGISVGCFAVRRQQKSNATHQSLS